MLNVQIIANLITDGRKKIINNWKTLFLKFNENEIPLFHGINSVI
jgi:hypothetical protein